MVGYSSRGCKKVGHNWATKQTKNKDFWVAFPCSLAAKNLPVKPETWVWSLGREDPLEKEMAIHSSIPDWEIPWTEGSWWAVVHGVTESETRHDLATKQQQETFKTSSLLSKCFNLNPYAMYAPFRISKSQGARPQILLCLCHST